MRSMRPTILLACVVVSCLACSPSPDPAATEPWPVFTEAPGVLGYAALPAAPADIAAACVQAIEWTPRGLGDHEPVTVLLLDEAVFGSPLALSLPVADDAAFRASMEDGRAILAPSFEAGLAARRVLDGLPGLRLAQGPMVASFDFGRFHLVYQDEIQTIVSQLRGLLLGAQVAGTMAMLQQMRNEARGAGSFELPIPGPAIWALLEMLSTEDIDGVQLTLDGADAGALIRQLSAGLDTDADPEEQEQPGADLFLSVRMVWVEDSPPTRVLAGLRPVEEVPDATALGFDPNVFPQAVAEWMRPLVELTMGEGAPAERLIASIAALIAPCQGTLLAGLEEGGRVLVLPLRPGQELDLDGVDEVLGLFARTLDLDADVGLGNLEMWDGETSPDDVIPAGQYWESDGVFFLTLGECALHVVDRLALQAEEAAARPRSSAGGPFLALTLGDVFFRMRAKGSEVLVELPLGGDPADTPDR